MYEYVCSPLSNENKVCFYNTHIAYYFIQKNNELRSPQDSVNKIMILLDPRLTAGIPVQSQREDFDKIL